MVAGEVRTAEKIIARIASQAHGVATRSELIEAGLSKDEIDWRLGAGALIRIHRGVYRVGHAAPSLEASYLAAVKACGPGALLHGPAAGFLYGLLKGRAPPPHVLTPSEQQVPGVVTRRARRGARPGAAVWRGIPITTLPRTLMDLAAGLSEDDLARACHEAGVRYRVTPREVETVLARQPNAEGASMLRRVMRGEVRVTLSKLEARFLTLLRNADLPLPVTNRPAGGRRVDCRWPQERLTVELDSYTFHNSRYSWEQDRRREREARARDDEFRRYSWDDVFVRPEPVVRELRELLARPAARGHLS